MIDGDLVLPESATFLVHLAEKTGRLRSRGPAARERRFDWLYVQLSGTSPAFGQSGYWQKLASEPQPAAIAGWYAAMEARLAVMLTAASQRSSQPIISPALILIRRTNRSGVSSTARSHIEQRKGVLAVGHLAWQRDGPDLSSGKQSLGW